MAEMAAVLVVSAVVLWVYASKRTGALRYVLPAIVASLVFVVFPMLYTVGMGFTNRSSTNLLDFERVHAQLLEESVVVPTTRRPFKVHAEGDQLRIVLAAPGGAWWATPSFDASLEHRRLPLSAVDTASVATAPLDTRAVVAVLPVLGLSTLVAPDGVPLQLINLNEYAQRQALYEPSADGRITDRVTRKTYRANMAEGFFEADDGDRLQPGFQVNVGWRHYTKLFTDAKFREPFLSVFVWTVLFAALSVAGASALGLLLASLLSWDRLRGAELYRVVLFLPYAVPGFLSILIFKGLFNQNLGEVNLILNALFGIKPAWFSDPLLAKAMLLMVNVWLGFPYMMVLCTGLLQSIPTDLREASSEAGAGPWTHFRRITLPLIVQPLTPLLIAAFAFNFNNFVLVSLLTGGRPDLPDVTLPAGSTDILVSYTWRMAFNDSGQQYGLAAAISTVIFLLVAAVTLVQMRVTRASDDRASRGLKAASLVS
jgi:maltose/maltodextrin transport system permease protein